MHTHKETNEHCIHWKHFNCNWLYFIIIQSVYYIIVVLEEHEILPVMEDEFPFIYLSPHTAKLMWQKQLRHISNLGKHTTPHKTSKIQRTIEDAQRKQKALAGVLRKEIEQNKRVASFLYLLIYFFV